jgi:hypothetical protein
MQQRRLTDSHCGGRNPRRGFEIVKTPRMFRIDADQPPHWRIVNPDAADVSGLIARGRSRILVAAPRTAKKALKMHNICG